MNRPLTWPSLVRETELLSPGLRRFVLARADGGDYPAFSAGAHILLTLQGSGRRWRNSYSLISPPEQSDRFEIIVRHAQASRGGSAYMHEQLRPGDAVDATGPANLFPIHRTAHRHLLLSAGIGITPFLSYLPALRRDGVPFHLHHICRAQDKAAFARLLTPYAGPAVTLHAGRASLDLAAVLSGEGLGTHLSVCGPVPFMDLVTGRARQLGWPLAKLHRETFGAAAGGEAFAAILRDGRRIEVQADETLLDALEAAGLAPPSLCRGGACGECRVGVLAGVPEHRDHVLNAKERERGDCILTCVSRARSDELVLDL
jgi:ferredoxin-NADP reductase